MCLVAHSLWLKDESKGERADLTRVSLRLVDLRGVKLSYADLHGVDLSGKNLTGANFEGVDLSCANLEGANLTDVNLDRAGLRKVNLGSLTSGCDYSIMEFNDEQLKTIADCLVKSCLHSENVSEDIKQKIKKLEEFANGFHEVNE